MPGETLPHSVDFPALRDPKYPVHKIADALEPYLRAIVAHVHPEKIILFGSQAYGEPTEHSDVDLLVVRHDFTSERDSNIEIRLAFCNVSSRSLPFTILTKTPEKLAERLRMKSPFYEDMVLRGVELYAAASN